MGARISAIAADRAVAPFRNLKARICSPTSRSRHTISARDESILERLAAPTRGAAVKHRISDGVQAATKDTAANAYGGLFDMRSLSMAIANSQNKGHAYRK